MKYTIYKPDGKQYDEVKLMDVLNYSFRPIKDNAIDIESIGLFITNGCEDMAQRDLREYINTKIVPSILHLNKEIQSIKEKM